MPGGWPTPQYEAKLRAIRDKAYAEKQNQAGDLAKTCMRDHFPAGTVVPDDGIGEAAHAAAVDLAFVHAMSVPPNWSEADGVIKDLSHDDGGGVAMNSPGRLDPQGLA